MFSIFFLLKAPSKNKKKGKKGKKKADKNLSGDAAEEAKKELISSLMAKCNMSEEQVLAAYDAFYQKYPSGEITQELSKLFYKELYLSCSLIETCPFLVSAEKSE